MISGFNHKIPAIVNRKPLMLELPDGSVEIMTWNGNEYVGSRYSVKDNQLTPSVRIGKITYAEGNSLNFSVFGKGEVKFGENSSYLVINSVYNPITGEYPLIMLIRPSEPSKITVYFNVAYVSNNTWEGTAHIEINIGG